MIIDWHAHVYPPREWDAPMWQGRCPLRIDRLMEAHEQADIDRCVVTDPIHYVKGRSDDKVFEAIKVWNDYGAEIAETYGEKAIVFSSAIPGGGDEHLAELERAIRGNGLRGVFVNSSHHGHYPDEDEASGFWDLVTELDIPVMMHAPHSSFGEECMNMYRLISSVGRPADEMLAIARLITRGVFERYPTLKFVGAHLGGGICEVIGRLDYAWELVDEAFFLGSYEPRMIDKPPSHYLRRLYLDTVSYHAPAVLCAMQTVGVEHLLFGSDSPPLLSLLPRARKLIEDLPIDQADREAILGGNAAELLGLSAPATTSS